MRKVTMFFGCMCSLSFLILFVPTGSTAKTASCDIRFQRIVATGKKLEARDQALRGPEKIAERCKHIKQHVLPKYSQMQKEWNQNIATCEGSIGPVLNSVLENNIQAQKSFLRDKCK